MVSVKRKKDSFNNYFIIAWRYICEFQLYKLLFLFASASFSLLHAGLLTVVDKIRPFKSPLIKKNKQIAWKSLLNYSYCTHINHLIRLSSYLYNISWHVAAYILWYYFFLQLIIVLASRGREEDVSNFNTEQKSSLELSVCSIRFCCRNEVHRS